jgi:signal transduction histidine kinase
MLETWQALSGIIAGLCAGLIGVGLARLPRTRIRPPVHAFVLSGVLWAVGDLLADVASTLAAKQLGIAVLYTGAIFMPALWWALALRWSEEVEAGLPLQAPAWSRLPLCWAGAMWLVMITNPWHGAFLIPVVGGRNLYQPLWYAMALPNYALILAALAIEVDVARRVARQAMRRQAAYLVAASGVTLLGNLTYVMAITPFNLTLVVLSVSGALLLVGMAREGLFGVLPVALPAIAADHPDGLVVTGPEGDVRYANRRAHALLEPLVLRVDRPLHETLSDSRLRADLELPSATGSQDAWWRALSAPEGVLFRMSAATPRWLSLSASSVERRRGRDWGHFLRITDVTSREQARLHERQTRRLESIADLARTISRDFQSAFAVVQANAELLSDGHEGDLASERQLTRISEAARYGSDLAYQLQLHSGSVDMARVSLDLSEVVEETCGLFESDLGEGLEVLHQPAEALLPVEVDAIQVRHAIFNLLENAIDATAANGGRILVKTGARSFDPASAPELACGSDQPPGDFAYVRIQDEGGGMDPDTEERAFEPFFSTRGKDRGNGLSTVLGVARAHGGLIALENDPGRGCTFTVYFPLERASG